MLEILYALGLFLAYFILLSILVALKYAQKIKDICPAAIDNKKDTDTYMTPETNKNQ